MIELLRSRYIPVAVDEWYHVRRKDPEGEFYRKLVYQREGLRPDADRTTQGLYIASPEGKLLRGWNNRDVPKARGYLAEAAGGYRPVEAEPLEGSDDRRLARPLPEGGLVARVASRVTEARWPPARSRWDEIRRASQGRDHLW
ncbi:MAG: hypothetical protein ACRD2T_15575, partial [Thermoanaerobaculia bacterium]